MILGRNMFHSPFATQKCFVLVGPPNGSHISHSGKVAKMSSPSPSIFHLASLHVSTYCPACLPRHRIEAVIKEALADPKHLIRKDRYEGTPLYWAETCIKGSNKQFGAAIGITIYLLCFTSHCPWACGNRNDLSPNPSHSVADPINIIHLGEVVLQEDLIIL